jgi:LysM repeat protein
VTSLRPFATCALLAAVGGFLYMKINESEPKLPAGAEEWSMSELDLGGDVAAQATPGTNATTPSATGAAPGEDAPPFVAAPVTPPTASATQPANSSALAEAAPWSPGPANTTTSPAAEVESTAVAHSAAETTPGIPSMPPLPGGDATTSSVGANPADVSVPELDGVTAAPTTRPPATQPPAVMDNSTADAATTPTEAPLSKPTMFSAARVAAQGALERGQLAEALATLSEWYGDPSLTPTEVTELNDLLSQLAGSVIYDNQSHRLAAPHIVQMGETLPAIADKYSVPWQLLAKINGVADPATLAPGQELKVIPGPFSAEIDLSERKLTLLLDRMYAGQFALELEPTATVEEGEWKVDQKLLTPAVSGIYAPPGEATEDRSLLLANAANPASPPTIVRGPGNPDPVSAAPRDRVIRLKAVDVADVYDILSEGSRVTVRR